MFQAARRTFPACLAATLALSPAAGNGRQDAGPTADLKQLSLVLPETAGADERQARRDAFEAAVQQIRACADVESVATAIDGAVVYKEKVPLREIPAELQAQLREFRAGGVTRVFGDNTTFRVLIRCDE